MIEIIHTYDLLNSYVSFDQFIRIIRPIHTYHFKNNIKQHNGTDNERLSLPPAKSRRALP